MKKVLSSVDEMASLKVVSKVGQLGGYWDGNLVAHWAGASADWMADLMVGQMAAMTALEMADIKAASSAE